MSLFDLTNVSSTGIEDGQHVASIAAAEVKPTKAGTGEYINVKWELQGGSSFYAMYTIKNPNQKAVDIGLGELKRMMLASGAKNLAISGVDELLGLRCLLTLKTETDDYGDKIKIKKYAKAPLAEAF
jgi:hypothetical protein